ncbi:MAG TPA: hypothetical protein VGQ65_23625 [Thermoanaerobaculia bacterium]|jgi:hypothetical protein|nr:hypothetical protein [Thermoanaerobaculia bacterium]
MTPQFILWGIPGFIAYYFLQAVKPARAKSGWDFVVEVGFLSLVCFTVSRALVLYVSWCLPGVACTLHKFWPRDLPFTLLVGIFPVSEVVGALLARLSRHWWRLMSLYHEWINHKKRDFRSSDLFFVRTTELLSKPIFITLKSGKVYVGVLTGATHDPNESTRFISFVPILSGYRDETDHRVVYTTFYEPFTGRNDGQDESHDFLVPVSELSSLAMFDWELLEKFAEIGNVRFDFKALTTAEPPLPATPPSPPPPPS